MTFFIVEVVPALASRIQAIKLARNCRKLLDLPGLAVGEAILKVAFNDGPVLSNQNAFSMWKAFLVELAFVNETVRVNNDQYHGSVHQGVLERIIVDDRVFKLELGQRIPVLDSLFVQEPSLDKRNSLRYSILAFLLLVISLNFLKGSADEFVPFYVSQLAVINLSAALSFALVVVDCQVSHELYQHVVVGLVFEFHVRDCFREFLKVLRQSFGKLVAPESFFDFQNLVVH